MAVSFGTPPRMGSPSKLKRSPVPDPLAGVEYSDNLSDDSAAELSALEQGYRERAKMEDARFVDATDSEYWFAVCFKTRAEKDTFLKQFGLLRLGDKYLDGAKVASILQKGTPS